MFGRLIMSLDDEENFFRKIGKKKALPEATL
jgi:hypothetical protein